MAFADNLKQLPPITHLRGLELHDEQGTLAATLENKPGSAGSVAVYAALAQRHGTIDAAAAAEGLEIYAEHTADARAFPGKHPNIDRLLKLQAEGGRYSVKLLPAA
ncbi:MAG: DUF2322 family protein [Aquabacterium sp.]|nr:MAG: DUF2322 family protein [Aquabacterium sp.]